MCVLILRFFGAGLLRFSWFCQIYLGPLLLLIPDVLSNGLNFASFHGPLVSLCGFKNTNHVTQNLSSRARQNETRGNEKFNRRQTKSTAPVVYILVADNFEDLGICFRGQSRMSVSNMGRTFCPGKALSDDLRRGTIDTIAPNGGDYISGVFLGNYSSH